MLKLKLGDPTCMETAALASLMPKVMTTAESANIESMDFVRITAPCSSGGLLAADLKACRLSKYTSTTVPRGYCRHDTRNTLIMQGKTKQTELLQAEDS
jgi:hypothetical protein